MALQLASRYIQPKGQPMLPMTDKRKLAGIKTPAIARILTCCIVLLLQLVNIAAASASTGTSPLRPADTSSPRSTLRDFITNANIVIEDTRQDRKLPETYRAYLRAIDTLDFSTTTDSDSWLVKTRRLAQLKAILDRIELPPEGEIPGKNEVAAGAVTQWTIPDTRIRIELIEEGPRAGEFLFSSDSVQQLDRFYRVLKNSPYKAGAADAYDAIIQLESKFGSVMILENQIRSRLKPVDTRSPRSTLEGFLTSMNQAYQSITEANAGLRSSPPSMTTREAKAFEQRAQHYLNRAISTLDMTEVPEALREDVGIETAFMLKEIIDRMLLPQTDSIPNQEMIASIAKQASKSSRPATPIRWNFPNTEIAIVEITEGKQRGQFLFSADTVERVNEFYEKVRDLDYRVPEFGGIEKAFLSPGLSPGAYKYYISTPGYLVPDAHFLGGLVNGLPDFFYRLYAGQTLWQWIGLFISVIAIILGTYLVFRIVGRIARVLKTPWDDWLRILVPVSAAGIVKYIADFVDNDLNITGDTLSVVQSGSNAIVIAAISWVVFRLIKATAETVIATPQISPQGIDAALLRLGATVAGVLISLWIFIDGLDDLGVDVMPLLAGLGVGGLAAALAARSTLENLIGSFMIFADRPFAVGQRVNVMGQNGTVESIGLRSTRIRLLNGHQTSIPNEKMASVEIENIGRRRFKRRDLNVTITYDTPPAKINRAVEILKEILAVPETSDATTAPSAATTSAPGNADDNSRHQHHPNEAINQPGLPPRVYFNDLNPDSLNIMVVYWYHPGRNWEFLEHAHWINIQIMERFNAAGIEFAFPTQTLHLIKDDLPSEPGIAGTTGESAAP